MPQSTITPSARGIGRGRLRGATAAAPARSPSTGARCEGFLAQIVFVAALGLVCFGAHALRAEAPGAGARSVSGAASYAVAPDGLRHVAIFLGAADGEQIRIDALLRPASSPDDEPPVARTVAAD